MQYAKSLKKYITLDRTKTCSLEEIHFVDIIPKMIKVIQEKFQKMFIEGKEIEENLSALIKKKGKKLKKQVSKSDMKKDDILPKYYQTETGFEVLFRNGMCLCVCSGDILLLQRDVDCLVCPENSSGKSPGNIVSRLNFTFTDKYQQKKQKLFSQRGSKSVVVTSGDKSKYKKICYVISSENIAESYREVFETVEQKELGLKSVAIPLLSTGMFTTVFIINTSFDNYNKMFHVFSSG